MTEQMHVFHDHPLSVSSYLSGWLSCQICKKEDGKEYRCKQCRINIHKDCADRYFSKPFQCSHILKIFRREASHILKIFRREGDANDRCYLCRDTFSQTTSTIARCALCNINVHIRCMAHQFPLTIFQRKNHKHILTLLLRVVTFTCDACGLEDDRNPFVCLRCNFMVHGKCATLPRVISINRHDHRISHTFDLGQGGDWKCGVCRKTIDGAYGAFTCSRCPSYAVHSKCATREEVWDGKELENVREKEEAIEDPFKVLNETDIIHFSHKQHILRLDENYVLENDNRRCGGCSFFLNDNTCYKCVECDFCLHKTCANLPRKKRHLLHKHKLTLQVHDDNAVSMFYCKGCSQPSSKGFRYTCSQEYDCKQNRISYDVQCSSVSEPFC